MRDSMAELSEENAALKAHVTELEAACTALEPTLKDSRAAYLRHLAAMGKATIRAELAALNRELKRGSGG
jgi:hypothetical protein